MLRNKMHGKGSLYNNLLGNYEGEFKDDLFDG